MMVGACSGPCSLGIIKVTLERVKFSYKGTLDPLMNRNYLNYECTP